jgi:ABC-type transporter Mla maintaining outer membrane lipid asymmetry ATPase subunit MlaF
MSPNDRGSTGPFVEIRGLHRTFGSQHVLSGIDLDVPKGGVFGLIICRSGCASTS